MPSPNSAKPVDPSPSPSASISADHKSRVILDSSHTKIADRPSLLEERLLKTRGVLSVEINAFSGRIAIEFDPTVISLETIKNLISSKPGLHLHS